MAYRDYNFLQRLLRWLIGVTDPNDEFGTPKTVLMSHEPAGEPVTLDYGCPESENQPHQITLAPTTVEPGKGIRLGALSYKVICRNAPLNQPIPIYNVFAAQTSGQGDELHPTAMDFMAIALDLTTRQIDQMIEDGDPDFDGHISVLRDTKRHMLSAQEGLYQYNLYQYNLKWQNNT